MKGLGHQLPTGNETHRPAEAAGRTGLHCSCGSLANLVYVEHGFRVEFWVECQASGVLISTR